MSHYSVTPWKFSTLLLPHTTLLPGCRMCDCGTRGHESISAKWAAGGWQTFTEAWACLHTAHRRRIVLSPPLFHYWDLSYPHAVQICLLTQWQCGPRGLCCGTLHILWTLWITAEGLWTEDRGSGFLLHREDLDVSTESRWFSWQAAGEHWGKTLSILNLSFILLLLSLSPSLSHTNMISNSAFSSFPFFPSSLPLIKFIPCTSSWRTQRLRIKWLSGRKFGSKNPSQPRYTIVQTQQNLNT